MGAFVLPLTAVTLALLPRYLGPEEMGRFADLLRSFRRQGWV